MGDDAAPMSSHRPYLLRALYEWIVAQEPDLDPAASVYDAVALGIGAAGQLLADYHHATAALAEHAEWTLMHRERPLEHSKL